MITLALMPSGLAAFLTLDLCTSLLTWSTKKMEEEVEEGGCVGWRGATKTQDDGDCAVRLMLGSTE